MWFIMSYITHPNTQEANRVCDELLNKKVIACYNLFPITSAYWWKGEIEKSEEIVSIVKTRLSNWELLQQEVKKLHSYQTPCIIKIEVEANEDYEKWIEEETKK